MGSSSIKDVILNFVCPSLGCVMASLMFAAPVQDLRQCLIEGSLGTLNPFPWAIMTGNCLGWIVYAYLTNDAFIVAANLPGLILSLWLNMGAAKLQYMTLNTEYRARHSRLPYSREQWDASAPEESQDDEQPLDQLVAAHVAEVENPESFVMVPQETALLRILTAWAVVIIWVGWFPVTEPASAVGVIVNLNLVFFYGAPLQTMQKIIASKSSESLHVPTMVMNWMNTSFWIAYGFARHDIVIILPNAVGLSLGLIQGVLCLVYPRRNAVRAQVDREQETRPSPEDDLPARITSQQHAMD